MAGTRRAAWVAPSCMSVSGRGRAAESQKRVKNSLTRDERQVGGRRGRPGHRLAKPAAKPTAKRQGLRGPRFRRGVPRCTPMPYGRTTTGEEITMQFGASMFFTDYSMTSADLAKALEERGFESIWAAEHSHIPLSRKSPWGGGGDLPKQYYDVMDPFVTLTAAACATKTLKLGTGVCLVNQ